NRNRTAPDSLDKRLAFDELKHEKARVVDFCDIVDGGDVGMVQRSEQLRFALESAGTVEVARKFLRQDFDGDVTLQFVVFGTIDLTHTALAEERGDLVRTELLPDCDRHEVWRDYSANFCRGEKEFGVRSEDCHCPSTSMLTPATKLTNACALSAISFQRSASVLFL